MDMHTASETARLLYHAALLGIVIVLMLRLGALRDRVERADSLLRNVNHVPRYFPDDLDTEDALARYRAEHGLTRSQRMH